MIKILALDLSTKATGCTFWEDGEFMSGGVLEVLSEPNYFLRILELYHRIKSKIDKFNPDVIAIEDYAYSRHSASVTKLAELHGIVKKLVYDKGYRLGCLSIGSNKPLFLVPITSWKKFCLGKGNLKKDQVMVKVLSKYGYEFDDNNIADSFCVGKFATSVMDYLDGQKFTKEETAVLKKFVG